MNGFLILGLALFSFTAQADILFIDFYHSANEVKAARDAAAIRGEELIVLAAAVPSDEENASYNNLNLAINKAQERVGQLDTIARNIAKMQPAVALIAKTERDALRLNPCSG